VEGGDVFVRKLHPDEMATSEGSVTSELGRLGAIFARRRWIWLPFLLVTPLVVFFSVRGDSPRYSASAEVFLNRQNQLYAGVGDPTVWEPPRAMSTQVTLASRPRVGYAVVEALKLGDRDGDYVASQTSVTELFGADILVFTTIDPEPALAATIATEYARQYLVFRRAFDTASLARTTATLSAELRRLEASGRGGTQLYQSLAQTRRRLETAMELQEGNAVLARPAVDAVKIGPRPASKALEALVLAVLAGFGLAYLVDVFDRRLPSPTAVADLLGLPLLATVPLARQMPRRRSTANLVAQRVSEQEIEAIRTLRTNLQLVSAGERARVIMLTSLGTSGAKPAVAPRLALALARAENRVVIVDLDFATPTMHRVFEVASLPGITDVLRGDASLDSAVRTVEIESERPRRVSLGQRATQSPNRGRLEVVTAGAVPAESSELLFGDDLTSAIAALVERSDIVLLEGPPLLTSSDALALARRADGVVLVAQASGLTTARAREARRLLEQLSTQSLGVVVTIRPNRSLKLATRWARRPTPRPV
jgi:Mrp family chromosome partitioning ATPase/capsular polysaccharide biosynthesis protein